MQQLVVLREEAVAEGAWFSLPDEEDDSVNFQDFEVTIKGPVSVNKGMIDYKQRMARSFYLVQDRTTAPCVTYILSGMNDLALKWVCWY